MSNLNIKRIVDNIRVGTTVYTPIVEVIVNAIQAIEEKSNCQGEIKIIAHRSGQLESDDNDQEIVGFMISDNGVGFTDSNREAFDTLYTDLKVKKGGKGFGRFTCLKYFDEVRISSVYQDGNTFKSRSFVMGKRNEIIINEKIQDIKKCDTGSEVRLSRAQKGKFSDRKLTTVARNLIERLLPYFVNEGYKCPNITLSEMGSDKGVCLNEYNSDNLAGFIQELKPSKSSMELSGINGNESFSVRVFKLYSPRNQKSKVCLVAHMREVTGTPIHRYIPEFEEEFYDKLPDGTARPDRNYIIRAYVFGEYLDRNVSLERAGFEFHRDNDLLQGISQYDIEEAASELAKSAIGEDVRKRQQKKTAQIQDYVKNSAPWHQDTVNDVDLSKVPYNPSDEQIESILQEEKFRKETAVRKEVNRTLAENDVESLKRNTAELVRKISTSSKNDLTHYVAMRRSILDLFERSLQIGDEGKYSSEGVVHDIIFPRKGDSLRTSFDEHNLWLIDERLNFTEYLSSDVPLDGGNTERPDLLAFDGRVMFRGDNAPSNPVTVFEFKRPQRDDFVNPSSNEDPVQQVVRYVNNIRAGKYRTPEGREMLVAEHTPFYGYVVCDLSKKVREWLVNEKDFKPMPDKLGYFQWRENINLYIEVLSWDKVAKDAAMRNRIFFHKLGI